jgi:hypothetical protein
MTAIVQPVGYVTLRESDALRKIRTDLARPSGICQILKTIQMQQISK